MIISTRRKMGAKRITKWSEIPGKMLYYAAEDAFVDTGGLHAITDRIAGYKLRASSSTFNWNLGQISLGVLLSNGSRSAMADPNAGFNFSPTKSIVARIREKGAGTGATIHGQFGFTATGSNIALLYNKDTLAFYMTFLGVNFALPALTLNTWYTFGIDISPSEYKVYLNGSLVGIQSTTPLGSNLATLNIGGFNNGNVANLDFSKLVFSNQQLGAQGHADAHLLGLLHT